MTPGSFAGHAGPGVRRGHVAAIGAIAVVALAATLFAGCAKQSRDEVVFWQFQPPEVMAGLVKQFEQENPSVKVRLETLTWQSGYEKIVMATSSGSLPDLLELGSTWFAKFAAEGALEDVTDGTGDLTAEMAMWDLATYGGRRFGIPNAHNRTWVSSSRTT